MTAEVSGAGSVEHAAAQVIGAHASHLLVTGTSTLLVECLCGVIRPTTHAWRAHVAEQLAAAGLLAAPVPAADADEVEVLAPIIRTLLGADWDLVPSECARSAERSSARDLLAALAPIRAAEVAAAEERGRRAGLAEAAAWLVEQDGPHPVFLGWGQAFGWAAQRLRYINQPTRIDETAPTTTDDYRTGDERV